MPETEIFQNELTVAVAHGRLRDHLPGVYREGRDSLAWESMARGVALPERWHTEVRQTSEMSFVVHTITRFQNLEQWTCAAAGRYPRLDFVLRLDGRLVAAYHKGLNLWVR